MWRLVLVAAWLGVAAAQFSQCNRVPADVNTPKTPGDNDFKIKISGNPQRYVPGEVYTVSLQGWRYEYSVQKFIGFILAVEPSRAPANIYGQQSVGAFTLYGDALTMHSEDCPNTVTHTSSSSKSEIQVLWTAPPADSDCVTFRATVVESRDVWYKDDGELTKELCEEKTDAGVDQALPIQECCACNEAKYEVTFEGLWSRHTHPKDFPTNEWLTHFSDIIGASHSANYHVWEYGGYASDGLRQVAEWGSTRALESELKRRSSDIRTIIKARGLWYPNVNGKTFAVFRVDNRHHLMSLVSMLGPTPDWIVGVSAMELCLRNCSWLDHKEIDLFPWDAGTDSGITYESGNAPTVPREKIRKITNSYPNDPKSPFYDPSGSPMKPLARLTITRHRLYEKSCTDPPLPIIDYDEVVDEERQECAVTEWSSFSPCSASCGKGLRMRTRSYIMPLKAQMNECNRQLEQREMCAAQQLYCDGIFSEPEFDEHVCTTSEWTEWTPCTVTCGKGHRMRNRHYLDRMGRKKCDNELVEKQMCVADVHVCPNEEEIPSHCGVTEWSDFSPCSASCGTGYTLRHRSFLVPGTDQTNCPVLTIDRRNCTGNIPDCTVRPNEADVVCMLEKDDGPCRGSFTRWYYDKEQQTCLQFIYGGCRGNRNRFNTNEECVTSCEDQLGLGGSFSHHPPPIRARETEGGPQIDCMVTPWSEWSPCSTTCGRGFMTRNRMVKVQPQNGGRRCPKKLERRRKCKNSRCNNSNNNNRFGGLESASLRRDPPPQPYQPELRRHLSDPDQEYIAPALFNPPVPVPGAPLSPPSYTHDTVFPGQEAVRVDCVMGEWGPWSPCTQSCGPEALQQRSRNIIVEPLNGGQRCGDRYQRRYCTLPPCPRPRFTWRAHNTGH